MPKRAGETEYAFRRGSVPRIRRALLKWGAENKQSYPWRETDSLWHRLLAEILLQRTRAPNVVPVYIELVSAYPEPDHVASLSVGEIERIIYPLGLHWRASLIKQLAESIARTGEIPARLEELPGVGAYIAAAFRTLHLGQRAVLIDSNIVRFVCRLNGAKYEAETRRKRWLFALCDELTPSSDTQTFNYALLDFAMQVCAPKPNCAECPLSRECCFAKWSNYSRK